MNASFPFLVPVGESKEEDEAHPPTLVNYTLFESALFEVRYRLDSGTSSALAVLRRPCDAAHRRPDPPLPICRTLQPAAPDGRSARLAGKTLWNLKALKAAATTNEMTAREFNHSSRLGCMWLRAWRRQADIILLARLTLHSLKILKDTPGAASPNWSLLASSLHESPPNLYRSCQHSPPSLFLP